MRIIVHGRIKKFGRMFVCSRCDCIFEANEKEYTAYHEGNGENWYTCSCPECGSSSFERNTLKNCAKRVLNITNISGELCGSFDSGVCPHCGVRIDEGNSPEVCRQCKRPITWKWN